MRDILSAIFREWKDQAQPMELADGDEDWFRLISREREMLRQRLAPAVAAGTAIDTTASMVHT